MNKNIKSAPANWRTSQQRNCCFDVLFFIFLEEMGEMRTIRDQLIEKGVVVALKTTEAPTTIEVSIRTKEHLSRKELEELMGVHRETYQKQGGAYRRRR